jgi:phage-related protein
MKKVLWVSSSKRDLEDMPPAVIKEFGYGLFQAQCGTHPDIAKVLKGFGGATVLELKQEDDGGAFRAVYTVRFTDAIVVLHVFQKKSKKGIQTPKQEIDLIHARLKRAEEIYKEWKASE